MPILTCEFKPPVPITPDMVIVKEGKLENVDPMAKIAFANIMARTPLKEWGVGSHDITPSVSQFKYDLEVLPDKQLGDTIGILKVTASLIHRMEGNIDQPQEAVLMGPQTIELDPRGHYQMYGMLEKLKERGETPALLGMVFYLTEEQLSSRALLQPIQRLER
jgi:hypothetical protein